MMECTNRVRTLLLVDDEKNILSSLKRVLRQQDYRVLSASNGKEGIEVLEKNPDVGVIVSDQRMPEMTGIEFLSKVREAYPDTVRLVLSGFTDLKTVTDAINRGAIYKFLTKPWEENLLLANVEEAFRYYELRRENERLAKELVCINQHLEQRVEEKTRQAILNLHALEISQEILENLPVSVLGIDSEKIIVVANQKANALLSRQDKGLTGLSACEVLPQSVCDKFQLAILGESFDEKGILLGDIKVNLHCGRMGLSSSANGVIVVITTVK